MSTGKNRGQGCVFSNTNYETYIKNLKILNIAGDGNCFYNCVSTAFNLENAYLLLKSKKNGTDVKIYYYHLILLIMKHKCYNKEKYRIYSNVY